MSCPEPDLHRSHLQYSYESQFATVHDPGNLESHRLKAGPHGFHKKDIVLGGKSNESTQLNCVRCDRLFAQDVFPGFQSERSTIKMVGVRCTYDENIRDPRYLQSDVSRCTNVNNIHVLAGNRYEFGCSQADAQVHIPYQSQAPRMIRTLLFPILFPCESPSILDPALSLYTPQRQPCEPHRIHSVL